jgi:hypothetical protein
VGFKSRTVRIILIYCLWLVTTHNWAEMLKCVTINAFPDVPTKTN